MPLLTTPIKLRDGLGNVQRFTTAEENYLSYQMGLQLAESIDSAGVLTTSSTGATSVGSYSNTFYNEPVGTHPAASISIGTITTTLYQKNGTASESSDSDNRIPIAYNSSTTAFREMADSDFNIFSDRLLSVMATNEYPGTYRLGSSSPGGTYDTHISNVFSDTRTDGTNVQYNIYQRQSISSPPSETAFVHIRRASGKTGTYQGLQESTPRQVKISLGQRAKNRLSNTGSVGTYQLRSSAQGAPTDPGTWSARGTATDTRQNTEESQFSEFYVEQYEGDFSGFYGSQLDKTYERQYAGFAAFAAQPGQADLQTVLPTVSNSSADPTAFAGGGVDIQTVLPTVSNSSSDPTAFAGGGADIQTVLPTVSNSSSDPTAFAGGGADVQTVLPTVSQSSADPTVVAGPLSAVPTVSQSSADPTVAAGPLSAVPTVSQSSADPTIAPGPQSADPTTVPGDPTVADPTVDNTTQPTSYAGVDFTSEPTTDQTQVFGSDPTVDNTTETTIYFEPFEPIDQVIPTSIPGGTSVPTVYRFVDQPTNFGTQQPTTFFTSDATSIPGGTATPTADPTIAPGPQSADPTTVPGDATVETTTDPTNDPTVVAGDATVETTTDPTNDPTVVAGDPTVETTSDPTTDPTQFTNVLATVETTSDPTTDPTQFTNVLATVETTSDPTTDPTQFTNVLATVETTSDPTTDPTQFTSPSQYSEQYTGQYVRQYEGIYARLYAKAYERQYGGTTIVSSSATIETYTLYIRIS